jgi:CelD/BcsL family acetyltransferase involved in cellulose biosynthesis
LNLDCQPLATEFGFRYGETYSRLQSGFDPKFRQYGVGEVLRGMVIKTLIAEGTKVYDFLAGDEPFKLRSGAKKSSLINLRCARSRSVGAIYLEMIKTRQFAKSILTTKA